MQSSELSDVKRELKIFQKVLIQYQYSTLNRYVMHICKLNKYVVSVACAFSSATI